jgi:hypothetical protein
VFSITISLADGRTGRICSGVHSTGFIKPGTSGQRVYVLVGSFGAITFSATHTRRDG